MIINIICKPEPYGRIFFQIFVIAGIYPIAGSIFVGLPGEIACVISMVIYRMVHPDLFAAHKIEKFLLVGLVKIAHFHIGLS